MSELQKRFDIRRLLGSGSFGLVYEALDLQRNRAVALKTLARADADAVMRFKREFRSLAELRHPNLASMYELLVLGDEWVLSMELVRGTDLLEHLSFAEIQSSFLETMSEGPFDPDERIVIRRRPKDPKLSGVYVKHLREAFRQLAEAIAFLHSNAVVHRDIKPSNVMIAPDGRVVLLDFGLAIPAGGDGIESDLIVGTPGYMSPEQIAMQLPAPPSDWYSFGVILYQALTGRMPFTSQGTELLEQQLRATPPPAASIVPGLPEDLAALADACLQRDPAARPAASDILATFGSNLLLARGDVRTHERPIALTGRARELRALVKGVKSSIEAGAGVVLLEGPPGCGKTTVADALLDAIRNETDALIIGGRCQPWESLPLNAIDAIVDSVARVARESMSPAIDRVIGRSVAMTRIFPTLAFPTSATPGDETVALPSTFTKAVRLASAELHHLLSAIAGERPIVLFLDDAQWGDYQSAEVFQHLLTVGVPPRIVLVCSFRSDDWRTSLLLQALRNVAVAQHEVTLQELSRNMVDKLVKKSTPGRGTAFSDAIANETGGNPALVEMILGHVAAGGDPPTLAAAIASRVGDLSVSARRVFALLLSSGPMAEDAIERTLELFESDEPLRTLAHARLIRPRRTGDLVELDVYHPRMREAVKGQR